MAQLNSKIIKYLDREVDFTKDVILRDDPNSSLVFALSIHNCTKYFLNGIDLTGGNIDTNKPTLFFSWETCNTLKLQTFNTFVIPPYTTERLIFTKQSMFFPTLRGVMTFSLGDFPLTEEKKKILIMFQIIGKGNKNQYALGFPKLNFSHTDVKEILTTKEPSGDWFSKGFFSKDQAKCSDNLVSSIQYPWDRQTKAGDIEARFYCGSSRHCLGAVQIFQTPTKKNIETVTEISDVK